MTAGEQRLPHCGVAEDARQAQLTCCLRHLNMLAPLFKKNKGPWQETDSGETHGDRRVFVSIL